MSIKIKTISVGCNRRDESSSGSCDPVDHAPNFPKLNRYAIPYALCSVAIAFCKIRSCYSYIVVLPCFSRVLYAYGQKIPMIRRISFRLVVSTTARIVTRKSEHRIIDSSQPCHWQTFWPTAEKDSELWNFSSLLLGSYVRPLRLRGTWTAKTTKALRK